MQNADKTDLFVIQGKNDPITPAFFGHQFMEKKYKQDLTLRERRLAIVDGGHSKWEFFQDSTASSQAQKN